MLEFILFIGLVVCFIKISDLNTKIDSLSSSLKTESQKDHSVGGYPADLILNQKEEAVSVREKITHKHVDIAPAQSENVATERFFNWLRQDFLVKLGAFLLLIGLGWFVSYAFANNWIGPVGRISFGILLGVSFMLLGLKRIEVARHQGGIFMVLGSGIVSLTVFAAREMFDIFTPVTALLVIFSTIVLIARVAVVYKSKNLATAGFLLAAIAPFLTDSPTNDALPIFLYLAVIVLGSLWILFRINAIHLLQLAFFTIVLYTLPYIDSYRISSTDSAVILVFGFAFTALLFLSNTLSIVRWTKNKLSTAHLVVALGSSLYVALLIAEFISSDWHSLNYIAWALVFAAGAFLVFVRTNKTTPFYLYGSVALGLLGAATVSQFSGVILTFVLTLEVAILVALALRFVPNKTTATLLSWLYVIPISLSTLNIYEYSYNDYFSNNPVGNVVFNLDFFILLNLAFCLGISAYMMRDQYQGGVLGFVSGGYVAVLVWLVTHKILPNDQATFVSLLIYTLTGLASYVSGRIQDNSLERTIGITILTFVIVRLLLVDIWMMAMTGKIITFLSIGTLLISTAFIKKLNKSQE